MAPADLIDPAVCFARHEQILRQDVSGSVVLFNMASGSYYALNDVGSRAWELCDGARSVAEVVAILAGEYDAPEAIIRDDVTSLFSELRDEHLLVQVDPAG